MNSREMADEKTEKRKQKVQSKSAKDLTGGHALCSSSRML